MRKLSENVLNLQIITIGNIVIKIYKKNSAVSSYYREFNVSILNDRRRPMINVILTINVK